MGNMENQVNYNTVGFNTFYFSWHEAMEGLTDEQYGKLSRALNDYCFFGIKPELSGIEKTIFIMAVPNIDSSNNKKTSGKKGGAPKGNTNAKKTTKKTTEETTTLVLEKQLPLNCENNHPCLKKTSKGEGEGEEEREEKREGEQLEKLFVSLWQKNGDVFNALSGIENFDAWQEYWSKCNFSPQFIETAVNNVANAVRSGLLERRYAPITSPDRFVLKGWLLRGLDDFKSEEDRKEQERERISREGLEKADRVSAEYLESMKNATNESLKEGFNKMLKEKGMENL